MKRTSSYVDYMIALHVSSYFDALQGMELLQHPNAWWNSTTKILVVGEIPAFTHVEIKVHSGWDYNVWLYISSDYYV